MLDGMSNSIQRSRIENLHSTEVDRQSPTGLIFMVHAVPLSAIICSLAVGNFSLNDLVLWFRSAIPGVCHSHGPPNPNPNPILTLTLSLTLTISLTPKPGPWEWRTPGMGGPVPTGFTPLLRQTISGHCCYVQWVSVDVILFTLYPFSQMSVCLS